MAIVGQNNPLRTEAHVSVRRRRAGTAVVEEGDRPPAALRVIFGVGHEEEHRFGRTVIRLYQVGGRGREVVELLRPAENDYFVLKPKHSGFFSTTLETLLRYLETQTLILTGIAGNFCVLFTANDAYMRDFNLFVPSDCTVSNTKKENDSALALMRKFLKADTRPSRRIVLRTTLKRSQKRRSHR